MKDDSFREGAQLHPFHAHVLSIEKIKIYIGKAKKRNVHIKNFKIYRSETHINNIMFNKIILSNIIVVIFCDSK